MNNEIYFGTILRYIGENYATCNLKTTAKYFNYHPDYLSSMFKKITNQTFTNQILEIRLEQACRYLTLTKLSVEEISFKVGYKDKSYFIKQFKNKYQMTPLKYRK